MMTMAEVDMHIHSYFSDGSKSPTELVDEAKRIGLRGVCLMDHDCSSGTTEFLQGAKEVGILAISGMELSTKYQGIDVHILIYGITPKQQVLWQPHLEKQWAVTRTRFELVRRQLIKSGIMPEISMKKLAEVTGSRGPWVTMMHYRYFLSLQGIDSPKTHVRAALRQCAQEPGWYDQELMPTETAIKLIKQIGGIPVLAHPGEFANRNRNNVDPWQSLLAVLDMFHEFKNKGLEVFHSTHSSEQVQTYLQLAAHRRFIVTGGSDFHGDFKPDVSMGIPGPTLAEFKNFKSLCEA